MNLIRNAIVYKAELPSAENLRTNLAEQPFKEPVGSTPRGFGFVPVPSTNDLVSEFEGGLVFAMRIDEKVVPSSAVAAEVNKRAKLMEEQQGYAPGRVQRRGIKEEVIIDFNTRALTKSTLIQCFYDIRRQFLIVPTASSKVADTVIHSLIQCTGSLKMTTIYVSDMKQGLTTRLKAWLDGDQTAFEHYEPCDSIELKRNSERVTVRRQSIDSSVNGLNEALAAGFTVTQMRFFVNNSYSFALSENFRIRSITAEFDSPKEETAEALFLHECSVQVFSLGSVMANLCTMFGYKPPVEDAQLEIRA